jgi:hypothetical protein
MKILRIRFSITSGRSEHFQMENMISASFKHFISFCERFFCLRNQLFANWLVGICACFPFFVGNFLPAFRHFDHRTRVLLWRLQLVPYKKFHCAQLSYLAERSNTTIVQQASHKNIKIIKIKIINK